MLRALLYLPIAKRHSNPIRFFLCRFLWLTTLSHLLFDPPFPPPAHQSNKQLSLLPPVFTGKFLDCERQSLFLFYFGFFWVHVQAVLSRFESNKVLLLSIASLIQMMVNCFSTKNYQYAKKTAFWVTSSIVIE